MQLTLTERSVAPDWVTSPFAQSSLASPLTVFRLLSTWLEVVCSQPELLARLQISLHQRSPILDSCAWSCGKACSVSAALKSSAQCSAVECSVLAVDLL